MDVKYSIIIPHKNIPNLLLRCLDSIPERSDIQVIVVDDNSNPDIVDFSVLANRKIELYLTNEGKGAGFARNIGISKSLGTWLLFADADDFFSNDFISLIDKHKDSDADIIFFTSDTVDSETLTPLPSRVEYLKKAINKKKYDIIKYSNHVPWGKMIKRDFVEKNALRFDELYVANDVMFSLWAGLAAKKILAINSVIYISTVRKSSLYYNVSLEKLNIRLDVLRHANDLLDNNKLWYIRVNRFIFLEQYRKYYPELYCGQLKKMFIEENIYMLFYDFLRFMKYKILNLLTSRFK